MEVEYSTNFSDMPTEILVKIFQNLKTKDLLAASQVCKFWNEITTVNKVQIKISRDVVINISNIDATNVPVVLDDKLEPAILFVNTNQKYYNLKINISNFLFENCRMFFHKIGENIQSLELDNNLQIEKDTFFQIMKNIKNPLKELYLDKCIKKDADRSGDNEFSSPIYAEFVNEFYNFCDEPNNILSKLEKLSINLNNLGSVRYYGSVTNAVFMEIFSRNTSTLKSIILHNPTILNHTTFLDSWQATRLEEINFNFLFQHYWSRYKEFILMQPNVKILYLQNFKNVIVEDLHALAKILTSTKVLISQFASRQVNNLNHILEMGVLRNYSITHINLNNLKKSGVVIDLFGQTVGSAPKNLKSGLHLFRWIIRTDQLKKLTYFYPNLVYLNASVNHEDKRVQNFTDNEVQMIIKNLESLKYLNLSGQSLITDYALTGINRLTGRQTDISIDKISGLVSLNLAACKNITNFALINAIKFLELKTLILRQNTKCTLVGFEAVLSNCPLLKNLIFGLHSFNYLDLLRVPRLKSYAKICNNCYEVNIKSEMVSFNFDHMIKIRDCVCCK